MDPLRRLAEFRIGEAIRRGELDDLPGKGEPVQIDNNPHVPPELRVAYKLLKNAGIIPQEVALINEINVLLREIEAIKEDSEVRRQKIRSLNEKQAALDALMRKNPQYGSRK